MKKIIPIMIAAAMLFAGCIVVLDTDVEADPDNYLYIGDHQITGSTDSGTGWSFSGDTLTLTGATIATYHTDGDDHTAAIYDGRSTGTLKIVLTGENRLTGAEGGVTDRCGIWINHPVEFSGSGSLEVNGDYTTGILTTDSMTVKGGTITITNTIDNAFDIWASALPARDGTLQIDGGTINLNSTGTLDVNGQVTIHGGTINSVGNADVDRTIIGVTGNGVTAVLTMDGGMINVSSLLVGQDFFAAGQYVADGVAMSENLETTTWGGVPCSFAEAKLIKGTVAGAASFGFAAPAIYTVSFDANGGSGTMTDVTGVSGEYTLPNNGFTAPSGKQFKCWSVADVEKNVGDSITVTANTTVKAIWQAAGTGFTVTFDANGGTGTMAQKTGVSGEYTLPESTFTAPDGKEFKCWKVGDDEKNAGDKITVSSDVTVKAVWKDKSSGGGSNIGLIIGGVVAGVLVVGAVAFFLIKRH